MAFKDRGMTLLEVLLAISVLAVGLFATAALQVRALQASEGARRDGQGMRLAHTLIEQARAGGALASADVDRWRQELRKALGDSAEGRVTGSGKQVSVEVRWKDPRETDWQIISLQGRVRP